jgi:FdhE protein
LSVNHLHADLDLRRQRAEARWGALVVSSPHLARAIALQRRTLATQLDLLRAVAPMVAESPAPAETAVLSRLADGLPVLRAELAPLPVDVLTPVAIDLGAAIAAATGYAAARRVADTLAARTVDPARLLALVYQRDQEAVRQLAAEHALVVDMLWLLGDLVVAPIAHLRESDPESPVREALERWDPGYCPACGSWPALAEFFFGERLLRCAFCACTWRPRLDQCVYCGTRDDRFATIVPDRQQPGRRLELCKACGGFLKALDAEVVTPFPLVAIEDLASADLDQAALHHGFKRMALRKDEGLGTKN